MELLRRYEDMLRNGQQVYFDAEDLEDIAYQYELAEQYTEALDAIEYGLTLHPEEPELLVRRAGYLLCLDRIEEADAQIESVPNCSIDALLIRAEIALIKGNKEVAIEYIDRLLDDDELTWEVCLDVIDLYLDYDCMSQVEAFVAEACNRIPEESGNLRRELARVYEEQQLIDKAIAIYNELLDSDPYSHADWFDMARLLATQGKYDEAIEACDFALAIDDSLIDIMIFRGCCLYDKGEVQEAKNTFAEIIKIAEDKPLAHAMMAACYSHDGLYSDAVESLKTALRYTEGLLCADLYFQLATYYYNLEDIPHTREALEKVLEIDDTHIDSMNFLGELCMRVGELERAEHLFLRVLELDSENLPANQYLARLMEVMAASENDSDISAMYGSLVIRYLERVSELSYENDIEALLSLALAHFKYGDVDKAMELAGKIEHIVKDSDKWNDLTPKNRERLTYLGNILEYLRKRLSRDLDAEL